MNINEAYLALANAQNALTAAAEGKPLTPEQCAKLAAEIRKAGAAYAELIGGLRELLRA
jgi:hypothetical protein